METPYLELKNISKKFPGVQALKDVSFSMMEGEVVALLGENGAGKSTLMNILGGVIPMDEGEINVNKCCMNLKSAKDAQRAGIAFIHQELSLFMQLSVQENLFIDDFPKYKTGLLNKKEIKFRAKEVLGRLEVEVNPSSIVADLPVSKQQLVEIAAAIAKDAKIIILDEPTTSLTMHEREKLFKIVNFLKEQGKSIIYITHDLEDAINISDRLFILRDGRYAGELPAKGTTRNDVIRIMVGRDIGKTFYKSERNIKDEYVLEAKNFSDSNKLKNVSFGLKKGEILGFYGLVGAGRTELIRAIFGLDKIDTGEVYVKGKKLKKLNPKVLINHGIGFLTEDRRAEGLFLELGIHFNISITALKKIKGGFCNSISAEKDIHIAKQVIDTLKISTPSYSQLAGKLSGGNQQKVVIGKWLHLAPEVFIFDEPTKGIDVGAKNEIYKLLDEIVQKGASVIFISSEIEEVIGMSDRLLVMSKGTITGELTGDEIGEEKILKLAMG